MLQLQHYRDPIILLDQQQQQQQPHLFMIALQSVLKGQANNDFTIKEHSFIGYNATNSPTSSGSGSNIAPTASSSTLDLGIALFPACVLTIYALFILIWRYLLPRSLKRKLDLITHDSITLDHLPHGFTFVYIQPVLWKSIAAIFLSTARLTTEIVFLLKFWADSGGEGRFTNKANLALRSTNLGIWALITIYHVFKHKPTPTYGLVVFYLFDLLAISYTLLTSMHWTTTLTIESLLRFLPCFALFTLSLSLPMNAISPSERTAKPKDPSRRSFDSPEDGTSLLSWLLVDWMKPMLNSANKGTLEDEDVWQISPFFQHSIICPVFRDLPYSTLMRKIYAFTAFDLFITSICSLVIAVLTFAGPYFLKHILEALSSSSPELRTKAYNLVLVAFLLNVLKAEAELFRQWHARRSYERVRGALIALVFDKATKRKDTSGSLGHRKMDKDEQDVAGADAGRILNMMNGDAYAVAQWIWEISSIIKAPIELAVAITFLYQILGWSCLIGLSTVFISYIVLRSLAKRNLALTRALMSATDRRISVISELVGSIGFLKYYAWEQIWVDKAIEAREKELSVRYWSNFNSAFLTLVFLVTPSMIIFTTFWCYTKLMHQELSIPVTFAAMSTFQMVQAPLFELPARIIFYLHTMVSVKRLDRFLAEPELDRMHSPSDTQESNLPLYSADWQGDGDRRTKSPTLAFHDAALIYPQHEVRDETIEPFQIICPDLTFPSGKLTVVYGDNASGKTSLLMACLGEMDCIKGFVARPSIRQAFAIATQDAWLEQATIKENILFGAPFDEERFEDVIDACALRIDLARWSARENTEIGERGISLSGGQRARVALARAIYSKAPYVLLDDPLSAVDAHTARHLVFNCLDGPLMKGRTCVLVTHHVKLCLPVAALLVRMSNGKAEIIEKEDGQFGDDTTSSEPSDDDTIAVTPSSKDHTPGTMTPVGGALISKENREVGSVKLRVYKMYLKAAGIETWIGILGALLASRGMGIATNWFLKAWGESYLIDTRSLLPPASENVNPWLATYAAISVATAFIYLIRLAFSYHGSFKAARSLLHQCLLKVTGAPSRWLDENPTGRLLNRFTADIGSVDNTINNSVTGVLNDVIGFTASLGAVLFVVPRFIIFALVCVALYVFLSAPYVRCSRDLRRLENNHRSPLFSRFGGLLKGLKVVRAFGQEGRYMRSLTNDLDLFQSMDHFFWTARFYLSLRFDFVGALAIYVVMLVALNGGVPQGSAAFAIVLTQQFVVSLHSACWSYAQLELDVNSIERIDDLLSTPQEPPAVIDNKRPPAHWPASGEIFIDNLAVRYAPHLPLALKDVSVTISPGQKVGIVGRTGSGKTTLALSLLRITEPTHGSIYIDGIDIASIGLRDLRERVTIISQESTLFEGTIRSNLDPKSQHSDIELWDVLRRVGMAALDDIEEGSGRYISTLEAPVNAGAENFSQGERQLISIARALLRRTNVFIADEATASVDFDTDEMVQHTLRRELRGATVITIAHRLRTVIDVDVILVLSDGVVKEFGAPIALLNDEKSAFGELCRQSNEFHELKALADARQSE